MKASAKSTNMLGKRLKFEMKNRGMSSAELAKLADVKTSFLYDVLSGKSANPSTITLARVAESLGVDLADLVGGGIDTGHAPSPRLKQENYITVPHVMLDSAKEGTLVATVHDNEPCVFRKSWIKDYLGANPADVRMFVLRGDHMLPTLSHNDVVLIDTSKTRPSPPGLFLIFDGAGLVVKRVEYTNASHTRLRVMSDNTKYTGEERDAQDTLIVGGVIWFGRGI